MDEQNEYFTRFVENLTKRTRAGELRWSVANATVLEKWLHADKSLCLFFCEYFGQVFYISFGTKGCEYVHEIVFTVLLKNGFGIYLSLAASELDSGFELALRELVDVVRFGRFKQIVEQCVVVERKEKWVCSI